MPDKRSGGSSVPEIQQGNQSWWSRNTMSYDWNRKLPLERFSAGWYDEIDARFAHAARLFATRNAPFDALIPFQALAGKRVLEIGCGMGLHSELMARAGAKLCAIDLSPLSVEATRKRFVLKGLRIDLRQADAETLPFDNASFDFVWSWGVIHHSSRTAKIVREIARVLSPEGECRAMVYNRSGICVPIAYLKDHLARAKFLRQSFDATLLASSDGFHARFYTPDQFADLFHAFFGDVSVRVFGQDSDALPLPHAIRALVLKFTPESWLRKQQSRRGAFLFAQASHPF